MEQLSRRRWLQGALAAASLLACADRAHAQAARMPYAQWVAAFRPRALARGISEKTYDRVMAVAPDTSVYALDSAQPEFHEPLWQYLNRRVSDWRTIAGKKHAQENAALLDRIERDFGVDRYIMLGLWGNESAFGDPQVQKTYMRPVIPALAAPPPLLGTGAAQRARHHRARLEYARRDARLLGRRHGPHAVDARGVAQCRPRLRRRRPHLAVRPAGRRLRRHRALFARSRQIPKG